MRPATSHLPEPPFHNPCVIYKPLTTYGGLELYAVEVARTIDAPIYTLENSLSNVPNGGELEIVEFEESGWRGTVLSRLPIGSIIDHLTYENFCVPEDHDAVITIGEVTKSIIHHPHQRRFHMLNMPPRWLFDQSQGRFKRMSNRLYQSGLRMYDLSTISRINDFVVPSEVIARRLQTYYGRDPVTIIYPPVFTDKYYFDKNGGYLLVLGRLAGNKRVGEIVDAVSETDYQLKIAGTGPEEEQLKDRACGNVEFLGFVSEERKRELLANCDALLFNSDREAFGIVPIEAFASGKPVVGIDEGFTKYQIVDGENGVLLERGKQRLIDAIQRMYETEWDAEEIQETATRYGVERFREKWQALLTGSE